MPCMSTHREIPQPIQHLNLILASLLLAVRFMGVPECDGPSVVLEKCS